METKHIKDSKLYVCDFNNLQDYFAYLREQDKKISFVLREYFTSMMEPKNMLEQYFSKLDTKIVYTTDDAPIMVTNTDVYIHPIFYKEHELDFLKLAKDLILERIANEKFFLYIPDFALDSDIVKAMCSNKKCSYFIDNVLGNVLTEEIINQFQNEHLQVSDARGVISTNKAIGYYTFEALEKNANFHIKLPINEKELENFKYINETAEIEFSIENRNDEKSYYELVESILLKLAEFDKKYNVTITCDNRALLDASNILKFCPDNIKITVKTGIFTHTKEDFQKQENILNSLVENIKNNDLSPLEKYLAVYDVVKKFKKYKENPEHLPESRFLHYILENEYIVCVGFANLMEALLHKVGISCTPVSTGIDISYVGGFTEEEKLIENVGHERNLVYLDDPKYGVKGYYLADATWDNNLEKDYYLNALMTFNRKKEAFHLETLNNEDLLFDFNSFEEFNKKINKYLIDQVRSSRKYKHQEQEAMYYAYKRLYDDLMKTLAKVDYDKFTYYYNKYNLIISSARQLDEIEPIMAELLTSYAKYILPRTNNEVTLNTIIKASSNARKILYDLNEEEALNWEKETLFINSEIETKNFPYVYDPQNELESSLEDRLESSIKL